MGAVAAVVARSRDGDAARAPAVEVAHCRGLVDDAARDCYTRAFLALVEDRDDPRPAIAAISNAAWNEGGFLLSNCHGVMHTVGRTHARDRGLKLDALMDALPRSNDPGCSAGFAHGLVTGIAPQLDLRRPSEAASICDEAATRYQRYSCVHGLGHAFMRIHGDRLGPALELCRAIGSEAPDCAQGAYHDYWFAVAGLDDARLRDEPRRDPWALCARQPRAFVRPCWYRAFVDNRPEGLAVESAEDVEGLCEGLRGVQRAGCVTAAAVIGPADPAAQLGICSALRATDAVECVRGTKVQNLLRSPISTFTALIERCEQFERRARPACYRWLAKTIAVVTDGAFRRSGCPRLRTAAARTDCRAGAATMNEPLVTFS